MLGCLTDDQCKAAVGILAALSIAKRFHFLLRHFFFCLINALHTLLLQLLLQIFSVSQECIGL